MADNNPKKPIPPASTQRTTMVMVIILLAVAFFVGSQFMRTGAMGTTVTDQLITSEFTQAVEQGRVKSVTYSAGDYTVSGTYFPAATAGSEAAAAFNGAFDSLNALMATEHGDDGKALGGVATTTLDPATLGKEHNYTSTYVGSDSLGELLAAHPDISYQVTLPSPFLEVLATLLPILIIGGLLMFFFYKMQQANNSQMSFGKNKAKKTLEERPDVTLADVAGEAGVPFFSISGSDFVEMFVGVGASRVRDLFKDAKEASPAIIFIDEIDAVGRQRGTGLGGGHDEREQTLNQLLVEMDGFESNDSVVLIAATNRADVLDPALLRPGRFDRQIVVDTPDVKGRQRILEVHSKDKPIGSDVDLAKIAKITPGFTGADLANLMNESALLTARRGKKIITMREVSESMERVIAGPERKGRVMNEKTKHTIAYHESGHALVGHLLDHADPVHKISIISRGRALGYTLSIPDEDKVLNSLSEMKDELAVFMGGRVAEEIFCDDITTGASNDLERASKMARAIVTQYGMSPLGTQVFGQPNHEVFLGRDYGNTQDYSEETARRIDEEVAKIMKEAHDRAHAILSSHADQMDLMASVLLERETVEGEACEALLDNKWDEYLAREDDIIAAKEAEEAAARAKDAELLAAQGEGDGASDAPGAPGAAPADPDAGETLADPNWRNEPVEPGDQDPNAPFRTPAEHADRADAPTQAEVNAEIDREDDMDSSADAPDPNKKD